MPSVSRRGALRLGAAGLAAGLAGCGGMPSDAVFATDPAVDTMAPSEDQEGSVVVVAVRDLPDTEAVIAETAISDGVYHDCDPEDAAYDLADRLSAEQAYFRFEGSDYPVYARMGDAIYATSADRPETSDCGPV